VLARARSRFALCLVVLGVLRRVEAQERARDAPFSCEPVVPGSVLFRGFALENYEPAGHEQRVRFQIEEPFFGLPANTKELEVPLEQKEGIARGEERIVGSLPNEYGPHWSAERFDEAAEKPYLEYLRGLPSGKAPARILGWTSGPDGLPLAGAIVRAVGAGREYEMQSNGRGTFEFAGLVPGKYRVTASHLGFETFVPFEEVEIVRAGCGVVTLPFEFEGTIRGAVKDQHGSPLQGLRVDLVQLDGDEEEPFESRQTDAGGNYRFTGIDPGRYRVGISLAHIAPRQPYPRLYAPGVEEVANGYVVQLSEEQPIADIDLWLPDPKLREFEINVLWSDGSPAKGATIALVYGRWHAPARPLIADDQGVISVWGYELLAYRIYAYAKSREARDVMASMERVILPGHDKVWIRLVLSEKGSMGSLVSFDPAKLPLF